MILILKKVIKQEQILVAKAIKIEKAKRIESKLNQYKHNDYDNNKL